MDDPWGSPWASSDTTSKHDALQPSPSKSLLSPPPRAFFSNSTSLPGHSPWADDDGFGGWTGADQTDNTINAEWESWTDSGRQISSTGLKPNGSGKSSPLAWPSSAAASPGLRPLPRSRASSVFRHHSPDPWASELSVNERPILLSPAGSIAQDDVAVESKHDPVDGLGPSSQEKLDAKDGPIADNNALERVDMNGKDEETPRESHDVGTGSGGLGIGLGICEAPSRASSTFSVDSHNGPERQDSPITSIDEDPKLRLQTLSRKPSGKVHELVGLYDGLAKPVAEKQPPTPEGHGSLPVKDGGISLSQVQDGQDGDQGGFGDLEDAEPVSANFESTTGSPSVEASPTTKRRPGDVLGHPEADESTPLPALVPKTPSVPVQQLIEKFGPITFTTDLQSVDNLFPDLDESVDSGIAENTVIPDRPITDSFASISERKTWYRISRYGSMRKHDCGDDDNYHGVTWSTSQLHTDTIKIVRRWMEEDSFAGRPSIGGSKRTSVFNWDSTAAPVELDKVFARRKSLSHSRVTSLPPSLPPPKQASTEPSQLGNRGGRKSMGDPLSVPLSQPDGESATTTAPVATFGWSSGVADSTSVSRPTSIDSAMVKDSGFPTQTSDPLLQAHATQIPSQVQGSLDDEDDDWGEMVSSPKVDVTPGLKSNATAPAQSNGPVPKLSVTIPQINKPPKQILEKHQSATSDSKTPRHEPWPLADFSIFDRSARTPNTSARTPKASRQDPWPLADFSIFESPTSWSIPSVLKSPKPRSASGPQSHDKAVEEGEAKAKPRPLSQVRTSPIKAVLGPVEKPNDEQKQDEIVQGIVQNLPDLSYMLR